MNRLKLITVALLLLTLAGSANALQVRTTVKYVSASAVYLDQGRAAGVQVGDHALITRAGDSVAVVEVVYLSDKSAACKIIESKKEILTGDEAVLEVSAPPETPAPAPTEGQPATPVVGKTEAPAPKPVSPWKLKGRAGVQYYTQNDRTAFNYDYSQPSFVLQGSIANTKAANLAFSFNIRARRTDRTVGAKTWENRYYEIALRGTAPGTAFNWTVGRTTPGRVSGVGYLDGLAGEYKVSPEVTAGAFAGAEPDMGGGATQWGHRKGGIFASYDKGDWSTRRISSTAALVGSYNSSAIEREFLYISNDASFSPKFSIYQNAEVEVNRGWRKQAEGGALKLSSLILSARYTVNKSLSLSLGYDNRVPIHYYEDRDRPDSLFDAALRQGARAGLNARLPLGLNGGADVGLNGTHGSKTASSASGYLGHANLLGTRVSANARASYFESDFSRGTQENLSLNRAIFWDIDLGLQGGISKYKYLSAGQGSISTHYLRGSADWWFLRRFYGSLSFEAQRGGGYDADRIYVDLGARL